MEQRQDDLGDDGLPRPGTEEPGGSGGSSEGDAGAGPGNVSVDEPTEGALDDPGTPGGGTSEGDAEDEGDTSEGTSEGTSEE